MKGYKVKVEAYEKWIEMYENYKDLCTIQEFFEYLIGVPTRVFAEYFEQNSIDYDRDFKPNRKDSARVFSEITTRNYNINKNRDL